MENGTIISRRRNNEVMSSQMLNRYALPSFLPTSCLRFLFFPLNSCFFLLLLLLFFHFFFFILLLLLPCFLHSFCRLSLVVLERNVTCFYDLSLIRDSFCLFFFDRLIWLNSLVLLEGCFDDFTEIFAVLLGESIYMGKSWSHWLYLWEFTP